MYCSQCGLVDFPLGAVVKAQQKFLAKEVGILPAQVPALVMLLSAGESRPKMSGIVPTRFHFHKDLFYTNQFLVRDGLDGVFTMDEFKPDWAGPTAVHLITDMDDLATKEFVRISEIPSSPPAVERGPGYQYRLDPAALPTVRKLARNLPPALFEVCNRTAREINALTFFRLREKVHSEFPQYWKLSPS
jgi:hypothetical protein